MNLLDKDIKNPESNPAPPPTNPPPQAATGVPSYPAAPPPSPLHVGAPPAPKGTPIEVPDWVTRFYNAAKAVHFILQTDPKHGTLQSAFDEMGAAIKEWEDNMVARESVDPEIKDGLENK